MAKKKNKSTGVARRRSTGIRKTSPRRRKRSGGLMGNFTSSLKPMLSAGAGGLGYAVVSPMAGASPINRGILGGVLAFALGFMNMPLVGAGVAGATASDLAKTTLGLGDDGDLEDFEYTREDLSENEYLDDDGNVYALSDDGEPVMIAEAGTDYATALADEFALSENGGEQSVLMVPTYM